ncbi:MAG: DNA ligase D, partial [Myxococcota bacterium]
MAKPLDEYRKKRRASATPEPFGSSERFAPGLFVLHKHDATRLHWDLRLEMNGVLVSWAVPKGPSLDPQEKRFAAHVEDHPIEYGDFEGMIPEGNYGAGAVILWDRGEWVPIEDPVAGLASGKLLFDLRGHKIRGRFTLVKTKRADNDWLLIKKPDQWAKPEGEDPPSERSILSGLTTDELAAGGKRHFDLGRYPKTRVGLRPPRLTLCETEPKPFDRPGWIFELKYDGFRLAAVKRGEDARLYYRSSNDATAVFPELQQAVEALPVESVILDGEVVVLDSEGKPSFNSLQNRALLSRARDIQAARVHLPAAYFAFDLLALNGRNLRGAPLRERRALLKELLPDAGPMRFSDDVAERGRALFAQVEKMGLEGIIAKDSESPYPGVRSESWVKVKSDRTGLFVVVGYSPPKTGNQDVGISAIAVAAWNGEKLEFAARVGSGFDENERRTLREALDSIRLAHCPCDPVPQQPTVRWCEPRLVARVRYLEWREGGSLRQPVFLEWVEADPTSARRSSEESAVPPPPVAEALGDEPRELAITNRDKMFWPEDGYTKGDLIDYYRAIAPWLLPHLADRPVVLTRYPDGIDGKNFFQKDAPDWTPSWVRRVRMWSEHTQRDIDYFVVDSVESLLYLANSASIPLHVWASRTRDLSRPDWTVIDLDPKEAPFEHVVQIARALKKLCDAIELPTYVKTTGSSGLHVMIPLGGRLTYEQGRGLAEILARLVVEELPEIATTVRTVSERQGRVYVDTGQNGHGRLIVSPFSVRPFPGAPVSMPVKWSQVT